MVPEISVFHVKKGLGRNLLEKVFFFKARALVIEAIKGGINNDLGSGSNVDVVHITINGAELDRSVYSTERTDLNIQPFKPGAAEILEEEIVWTADVNNDIEMPEAPQDEAMQD